MTTHLCIFFVFEYPPLATFDVDLNAFALNELVNGFRSQRSSSFPDSGRIFAANPNGEWSKARQ
jgi:hypothetical protein